MSQRCIFDKIFDEVFRVRVRGVYAEYNGKRYAVGQMSRSLLVCDIAGSSV